MSTESIRTAIQEAIASSPNTRAMVVQPIPLPRRPWKMDFDASYVAQTAWKLTPTW